MTDIIAGLSDPSAYPHDTKGVEVVETHISLLFLTGTYAYKVKKSLDLGFLDFSSLRNREYYCREELRLNRRLCPELYLDVVPVTEKNGRIRMAGEGRTIDHAVKMIQFDRDMELDHLLSPNRLNDGQIDQIASVVAAFHLSLAPVVGAVPFGRPDVILKPVLDNFAAVGRIHTDKEAAAVLETLKSWTDTEYRRLLPLFSLRKASGRIRQCHGDMHTGNMVLWNGRVMIFDCIEFNPFFTHIDVLNDIAFLVMDLEHRGHREHAWRFLNDYLSLTGDYDGLPLLRFYKSYRAMVRAKITAIRLLQESDLEDKQATLAEHRSFIDLTRTYSAGAPGGLVITCGVSGSGKTTFARRLAQRLPAIHIRSDIERKRFFGIGRLERSGGERKRALYASETTRRTYAKLRAIASGCLDENYPVIVDATFLREDERKRFVDLAGRKGVPVVILHCRAPDAVLERRVRDRHREGVDASEADHAVLALQQKGRHPLSAAEREIAVSVDTSVPEAVEAAVLAVAERVAAGK